VVTNSGTGAEHGCHRRVFTALKKDGVLLIIHMDITAEGLLIKL
jgi:hypothetical protein